MWVHFSAQLIAKAPKKAKKKVLPYCDDIWKTTKNSMAWTFQRNRLEKKNSATVDRRNPAPPEIDKTL